MTTAIATPTKSTASPSEAQAIPELYRVANVDLQFTQHGFDPESARDREWRGNGYLPLTKLTGTFPRELMPGVASIRVHCMGATQQLDIELMAEGLTDDERFGTYGGADVMTFENVRERIAQQEAEEKSRKPRPAMVRVPRVARKAVRS